MKKLIILLAMLIITGCSEEQIQKRQKDENQSWIDYNRGYKLRTIDGCEYIETGVYGGAVLTHKGNCRNPIHKERR